MAVVLHYRFWPAVRETLDALLEQLPPDMIVIVDNASLDGSSAEIRKSYPECRLVEADQNRGYGAGMNLGVRYTSGDVLLLTHECLLSPGTVATLEHRFAEHPDVGIAGPVLMDGRQADVVFSAGGIFDSRMRQFHRHVPEPLSDDVGATSIGPAWLDGSCLLIRRAVLDRRRFDEGYFLYFEDTEFCVRAGQDGWRIECVPGALAHQAPGVGGRAVALWTRNRLRFVWRNARRHFAREFARTTYWGLRSIHSRSGQLVLRGIASFVTREDPERLYGLRPH
jgi:hypothetical protein